MRPLRWASELNFMLDESDGRPHTAVLSQGAEALKAYLDARSVDYLGLWVFEARRGDANTILTFEQAAKMLIDDGGSEDVTVFYLDKR